MRGQTVAFLACVVLLVLTACSGSGGKDWMSLKDSSGGNPSVQGANRQLPSLSEAPLDATAPGKRAPTRAELDAEWQAILRDPGVAGVDYDASMITVNYFRDARLPSAIPALKQALGESAAGRPNAILRENVGLETITDAIAGRYGLRIDQQIYLRDLNFASFILGEGADGERIIKSIRREFAGAVQYVTYSRLIFACYEPNDPDYIASTPTSGPQWGIDRIGGSQAWDYTKGDADVWIAIVDTGAMLFHEELSNVLDPEVYFPGYILDLANNDNTMEDTYRHGTNLSGIVVATQDNNRTVTGVAPECRVVPVKISNSGFANHALYVAGCMLGFELGAKVVNLSWKSETSSPQLEGMVNDIFAGGALLFVSAGNDADTLPNYPAAYENAVSVGNSQTDDSRNPSSNWDDYVDIAAPGADQKTTCIHAPYGQAYRYAGGTSMSAPITAASAALLWSYDPALTNVEVRELLETTGAPTTGFSAANPVLRLDIGAAFEELTSFSVIPPKPDQLVHSGLILLEPGFTDVPDSVEVYLNGELYGVKTSAPWSFDIDTTGTEYGLMNVSFVGTLNEKQASAEITLLVDNSPGVFPVMERFEEQARDFLGIDLKGYSESFLQAIKFIDGPGGNWDEQRVSSGGPAAWLDSSHAFEGLTGMCLGEDAPGYGAYEIDALVSRRLALPDIEEPTAVFYHRFDIQDGGSAADRVWVYVTDDEGNTFYPATLRDGSEAYFTGYQPGWEKAEIDLSAFAGSSVHVAFVFESDQDTSGGDPDQPAWCVDQIAVAAEYAETFPTISGVSITSYSVFGSVVGREKIDLSIYDAERVVRATYTLDLEPLGISDPYDKIVNVTNEPFPAMFDLPLVKNQLAELSVRFFDAAGNPGIALSIPLYLFNLLGDTNADNTVDEGDLTGFYEKFGLTSQDEGYVPFYDTDLDGVITELDAAYVGYHWGESIP